MSDITNRKSNTKVLITLVHGTWARFRFPFSAPAWFDKNSSFSQHLLRSLAENDISAEITAFIWSGANSLAHRKDAAHQLSRALSKQHANYPDLPQLTIGHSHGGSICLLSLPEIPTSTNILTVTLATPLVEIISSEFTGAHQRLTNAISGGLVGPSTIGLLWVIIVSLFLPDQPTGAPLNIADLLTRYSGALYFIALFFAHGAAAFLLLYGFKSRDATNEAPEDLAWHTSEARSPQYFASLTNGGAKIAPPRKALILRGVDDEAGLVLAAASIGTKIVSHELLGINRPHTPDHAGR